jgi:hypothetical protein
MLCWFWFNDRELEKIEIECTGLIMILSVLEDLHALKLPLFLSCKIDEGG